MESGATAWEIRDMASQIKRGDLPDMVMAEEIDDDAGPDDPETSPYFIQDVRRDAILIEALECLAAKKEAERA